MREMLQTNIRQAVGDVRPVALSFSGGTDSLALLFACFDLRLRPTLYTYYVGGHVSEDAKRTAWAAERFHLAYYFLPIEPGVQAVYETICRMLHDGVRGKVALQSMHGHYAVAPAVRERVILNGSGVDALYGAYRQFILSAARLDKTAFDEGRQKHLENPNDDAMVYQTVLYARYGVRVAYPYRQKNIIEFLMNLSWAQINRPRLKAITLREFPEILAERGLWRSRGSQQIVAGTRELHNSLIDSQYNKGGRRRVDEIYKDILREIHL